MNFSLVFASIMLEALPFMLLGAVAGGLLEVFVSRERMARLVPKSDLAAAATAAALGIVFPVCECAIVPVARRLAGKGLPAAAVVAYLLAGPIVNPVVALSTLLAYTLDWRPMVLRLGFGYIIAVCVAFTMAELFRGRSLFAPGAAANECSCGCSGHDHHHHHHHPAGWPRRMADACNHALDDFILAAPYLVAGAALAALAQTGVDRRLFLELASSSLLPSAVMTLLAILLNLCSEADAFIAASFRGLIPFPAQLAFLVVGPMLDLKLLLMYRTLFTLRAVPALAGLVLAGVAAMTVLLGAAGGGL